MAYGGKSGGWKGRGNLERSAIRGMAVTVHICSGCGLWHEGKKPPACLACGRMDFITFGSKGEAKMFARLEQRQRVGMISELERQVRIPLLTVHHATGKPVEFATYVADFRWRDCRTGDRIVAEFKPRAGMSYDASLKIRCCEAMGIPVEILTD
jgi:hypothetical protein